MNFNKMLNSLEKANFLNKISFFLKSSDEKTFLNNLNKYSIYFENKDIFTDKIIQNIYFNAIEKKQNYLFSFLNKTFKEKKYHIFQFLIENNLYDFEQNILDLNKNELLIFLNEKDNLGYTNFSNIFRLCDENSINNLLNYIKTDLNKFDLLKKENQEVVFNIVKKELKNWYYLIDNKDILTTKDENNGYYPAHFMSNNSYENYLNIFNLYKKNNIEIINLKDKFQKNPYINIIRCNNIKLLEHGLIEYREEFFKHTKDALHTSIYQGNNDLSKLLIDYGAKITEKGFLELDPFWLSIRFISKNKSTYKYILNKLTSNDIEYYNSKFYSQNKRSIIELAAQYLDKNDIVELINKKLLINDSNLFFDINEGQTNIEEEYLKTESNIIKTSDIYYNIFIGKKEIANNKFNYFYNDLKVPIKRLTKENLNNLYITNNISLDFNIFNFFIVSLNKHYSKTKSQELINFLNENKIILTQEELSFLLIDSIKKNNQELYNYVKINLNLNELKKFIETINKHEYYYKIFNLKSDEEKNYLKFYIKNKNDDYLNTVINNTKIFNKNCASMFSLVLADKIKQMFDNKIILDNILSYKLSDINIKYIINFLQSQNKEKITFFYQTVLKNYQSNYFMQNTNFLELLNVHNIYKIDSPKKAFDFFLKYIHLNLNEYDNIEIFEENLNYSIKYLDKNQIKEFYKLVLTNFSNSKYFLNKLLSLNLNNNDKTFLLNDENLRYYLKDYDCLPLIINYVKNNCVKNEQEEIYLFLLNNLYYTPKNKHDLIIKTINDLKNEAIIPEKVKTNESIILNNKNLHLLNITKVHFLDKLLSLNNTDKYILNMEEHLFLKKIKSFNLSKKDIEDYITNNLCNVFNDNLKNLEQIIIKYKLFDGNYLKLSNFHFFENNYLRNQKFQISLNIYLNHIKELNDIKNEPIDNKEINFFNSFYLSLNLKEKKEIVKILNDLSSYEHLISLIEKDILKLELKSNSDTKKITNKI